MFDSYARLSKNPSGVLEKVEDQHADNGVTIERAGAVLGEELTDNSLSAWHPRVRRPAWERLLARLESGESDGVAVWHVDRLMRLPRDLERLLELSDRGVSLRSSHGHSDLADANDRFTLRMEVAHSCRSSDDASRRIKRRLARLRADGVAHAGARRFGFGGASRVAADEGAVVSTAVVHAERRAVAAGTEAVLGGASWADVATEWTDRGLVTATGLVWTAVRVREVLLRPINAGIVEHDGQYAGRMPGEPIVAPDRFERLRAKAAGRRRGRPAGRVYLGSGVLRCGPCGHSLSGRPQSGHTYPDGQVRRQYHCPKSAGGCGRVAADMRGVDRELREFTARRLSDPAHAGAIAAGRARVADRLAVVQAEIAECETLQDALSERLGRREMTLAGFDRANAPLVEQLTALATELDTLTTTSGAGDAPGEPDATTGRGVKVPDADTIRADWDTTTDPNTRRAMLISALGTARLVLDPATTTGRFDPTRVRYIPPPDTATTDTPHNAPAPTDTDDTNGQAA